jgi:hypothetical protein
MPQDEMKAAMANVFRDPWLLPGEDRADYEKLKQAILKDRKPKNLQEMFVVRDIVDAEWEHQRMRDMKMQMIYAAIPRVVRGQIAEALDVVPIDGKTVPIVRKGMLGMDTGDAASVQEFKALMAQHHLTMQDIAAAAFSETIGPQVHAARMASSIHDRRNASFALLDEMRAREQKKQPSPRAAPTMDEIAEVEDEPHPIVPADVAAADATNGPGHDACSSKGCEP